MFRKLNQPFYWFDHGGRPLHWSKFLVCALFISPHIYAKSQQISLNHVKAPLKTVLRDIKQQTGYEFLYNNKSVDDNTRITVVAKNTDIDEAIESSLRNTELSYTIKDNIVLINKNNSTSNLVTNKTVQRYVVKGIVKSTSGKIIQGAIIRIPALGDEVVADVDGNFEISVNQESVDIEVSFLGFKTYKARVDANKNLSIVLVEDLNEMDEVVVVGYGKQKKSHLAGAVSQIDAKELTAAPMQNISNMLTGKLPGLTSIQSSGKPGEDGTALYVRGVNSFAGSNGPLILVDGVPRLIDYVNPNDVESVTVLKDAAAAIYGIQGANGVILITTKKGELGKAKISYDGSSTLTQNTAMPEMLNASDYMYWHNKARSMDGLTPLWTADIQNKVMQNDSTSIWGQTDWMDKVFRTGHTQQHNISANGGTERTRYFTSLGIMDQEGTLINTDYRRINFRSNLDVEVAQKLKLIANVAAFRADRDWPGTAIAGQAEFSPIRQAINSIPIIKDQYNGLPTAWNGAIYNVNGYAALTESGYQKQTAWNFDTNIKLEYDFAGISDVLRDLKVSILGSYNYTNTVNMNYDRFYQLYTVNQYFNEVVAGASGYSQDNVFSKSASWGDSYLWRPEINFQRDFGQHYVGALLLFEARKNYSNTMTGTKRGYYSDEPVDLSLGSILPENPISGSHVYSGGQTSYVGRFNYVYDSRYIAEFAFRYDGSYIFAPGNQWGFFPSASVAWVMSRENFFNKLPDNISNLKLRASYGKSGNDAVSPFQHNSLFGLANNSMIFGDRAVGQFYSLNPYLYRNLKWASTDNYNVGFDIDFWGQKLGFEFNAFYKLTKDILESQGGNYPSSLGGYFPSFVNSGKVENKGFEVSIKHVNSINSDWSYNLRADIAFARNKVLSRIVSDNRPNYRAVIGESIGARYGFEALGLFQSVAEIDQYPSAPSGFLRAGDLKYQDVNGDGIISSEFDYVRIGYGAIPELNFALNLGAQYKNLSLSMLWQGVSHVDYELSGVYNSGVTASTVYTSYFPSNGNSPYYLIEGAWTEENSNAKYPRLSTVSNGNNAWQSSWWVVNGEYLRLKNLNLTYRLPEHILTKTPFSNVSVFLAGSNLLTFSHFKYVDPESPSVSNGYYPQQKTYSLGLNVTF